MQNGRAGSGDDESAALTYQVYAPEALPPARPMNLSRTSFPDVAPKPNIAARVALALVAACVVVGTAVLVVVGTADEPHAKTAAATNAASMNANAIGDTTGAAPALAIAPVTSAAPIADPPPVADAPIADPPAPPPPVVKTKSSKAKGASSAGALRHVALPPNPFGGGGGAAARPSKKK